MKVCIYGAGAIGGHIGAMLARSGVEVSLVARGAHLEAIRKKGLRLRTASEEFTVQVPASDDPGELGRQDYVILTLKAHQASAAAAAMRPLLGPKTAIVTAMNGIPFWYFYGLDGPWRDHRLEAVDPGGVLWDELDPQRVIGCVVYSAAEVIEPGVILHEHGERYSLGEPDGSKSERVLAIGKALAEAGLKAPVKTRIRDELWFKLWGNLSFNPISVLTLASLDKLAGDPGTRAVARSMMIEAQAIAEKLGVNFPMDVDKRMDISRAVGAHKPSTLQDLERGRPMEIDALVTAVQEMGVLTQTPTPIIDTILALVQQRARIAGLA
ncbi:MAG: 2-dehydropantoate 2-reductase [Alphaproteobacteria bacterium]